MERVKLGLRKPSQQVWNKSTDNFEHSEFSWNILARNSRPLYIQTWKRQETNDGKGEQYVHRWGEHM